MKSQIEEILKLIEQMQDKERKHPNKSSIEFINDVFNPADRVEKQVAENTKKVCLLEQFISTNDAHYGIKGKD
jgi:hypothetical protein